MFRTLLLAPLVMLPAAAHAAPAAVGDWHVTGDVSGHAFALDCRFAPARDGFTGQCAEAGTKKVHELSSGTGTGDKVAWTYPVSVMLMKFEMKFAGTLAAGRITGTTAAAGRSGTFVATRK